MCIFRISLTRLQHEKDFCDGWFCESGLTLTNTGMNYTQTLHTLKSVGAAFVSNGLPGSNGNVNHISLGDGSSVDQTSSSSSPEGNRERRERRDRRDEESLCAHKKRQELRAESVPGRWED